MKKLTLAATLTAALTASAAHSDATLMVGSWTPSGDPISLAIDDFKERIANEGVDLQTTYDGQIITLRTGLTGIRDNVVDIGVIAGLLTPAETQMEAVIMDHATIVSNPYAMSAAVMDFVENDCERCRSELEAQKIKPLAYFAQSSFYLMCREPVEDIAALNGKAMRGVVAYSRFIEYLGGVPVYTSPGELQEAMNRGQVECAIGAASWLSSFGLADVVNYVADISLGQAHNNLIGMNQDAWDRLSPEDQQIITDNLPYLIRRQADHNRDVVAKMRETYPDIWAEPTGALVQAFADFQELEKANVVTAAQEKGVENAETLIRGLEAQADKWNGLIADTNGDPEAIEKLYRDNLYGS